MVFQGLQPTAPNLGQTSLSGASFSQSTAAAGGASAAQQQANALQPTAHTTQTYVYGPNGELIPSPGAGQQ